jgi:hypothetical protein
MDDEQVTARYRRRYRKLLNLYPQPYRARFAESMEQTFADLYRDQVRTRGRGLTGFMLWILVETSIGIVRERAMSLARYAVTRNSTRLFMVMKFSAIALGGLMVAGILTLMILARGTGEDIAGIVAMALLVTLMSAVAAIAAALLQRASERRRRDAGNEPVS